MASLNEIAYDILTSVKPHLTDDSEVTIDDARFDVGVARNILVKRALEKNSIVPDSIVQDLGCLELELADPAECCDISLDCKVLRTKKKLPRSIVLNNKQLVTRVGPINKLIRDFSYVTYERAIFSGNGQFSSKGIFAFLLNDRIYISSKLPTIGMMKYINVRGVFEDPREAAEFSFCDSGGACYSDDDAYPIDGALIGAIKDMLFKQYLKTDSLPQDLSNDTKDQNTDAA